jgi:hypothetical protein
MVRGTITKVSERQAQATATYEHELLATSLRLKQMLPYRGRIRSCANTKFDGWVHHDGDKFLSMRTAAVRPCTEIHERSDLRRGDLACYDGTPGQNVMSYRVRMQPSSGRRRWREMA